MANATYSDSSISNSYFNESWNYYQSLPATENMTDEETFEFMKQHCDNVEAVLQFDNIQLARVIVTWVLFFISAVGNSFVLFCICRRSRTSHVHLIMMHFAVADLAFTFMVMPRDAMWNTTMMWYGGDFLCRLCQLSTQAGMYISSFMVVVTALDRCCGILQPMSTPAKQRRRTKYLVSGAWILSIISAIPSVVIFSVVEVPFCPTKPAMAQCVDYALLSPSSLMPYQFFTMAMSFLFPMSFSVVFYSLVVCEISNMMQRDRVMMGRRDSSVSITRARRKTIKMTAMVTLSFLLFWGPYYGHGIYDWFNPEVKLPRQITMCLFLLMYIHPAIHPFMYGVLMKDVRDTFKTTMLHIEKIATCSSSESDYGDSSPGCLSSPRRNRNGNGYSHTDDNRRNQQHLSNNVNPTSPIKSEQNGKEGQRLISANSASGGEDRSTTTNNGVLRTSTVSFKLNTDLCRNDTDDTNHALNNNNKDITQNSREDGIITSTDV